MSRRGRSGRSIARRDHLAVGPRPQGPPDIRAIEPSMAWTEPSRNRASTMPG
jgi:hypothetical protein